MARTSIPSGNLSPKYAVMGFLYIRPMHGYELDKQLRSSLREVWRISQSQTYNILKNLEKEGVISATHQEQDKKPDKDLLTLTEKGKAEFEYWLYTPTPGRARAIRVEFITRLFFAAHLSASLPNRIIQEQAETIRTSLKDLRMRFDLLPMDQLFNRLGLDLRIRQLETTLNWIENTSSFFHED